MRPFEIAIHLSLATVLFGFLLFPHHRTRWINYLPILALFLVAIHLATEGYRWQMIPAYAVAGVLFLFSLRQLGGGVASRGVTSRLNSQKWVGVACVAGLLLLSLSATLGTILPVPALPAPNGPYPVGTTIYHFVDETREEIYNNNSNDKREIMVQVWYPTTSDNDAEVAPWIDHASTFVPALAEFSGLPPFMLNHLISLRSNSFADAPLAPSEASYPVIVYSHGWTGFRALNSNQMETLASHGYVAVGIDHTYGALATIFPDGRLVPNNPDALPNEDSVPAEVYDRASNVLVNVYASDVRFVLDQLAALNAGEREGRFTNRLDLERIGVFGHSTGGGAMVKVCSMDERCKAGLGMDAWVKPLEEQTITQGVRQPFLFMRSDKWTSGKNDKRLSQLIAASTGAHYRLAITGTLHRDFTMHSLLSPLITVMGVSGPLDGRRALQIMDDYLLAFFDKHLKGENVPLLDGPSPDYPEVQFEKDK